MRIFRAMLPMLLNMGFCLWSARYVFPDGRHHFGLGFCGGASLIMAGIDGKKALDEWGAAQRRGKK